jgi:hypothetical protein
LETCHTLPHEKVSLQPGLSETAATRRRDQAPGWWLLLIAGVIEVALGVLALAAPGATLAALITVLAEEQWRTVQEEDRQNESCSTCRSRSSS